MAMDLLDRTAHTSSDEVVEILGEYNDYLMDAFHLLDSNCARVLHRADGYYVIPFGRMCGQDYEDSAMGPYSSLEEAREEAKLMLYAAEG